MFRGAFEPAPYRLNGGAEESVNVEQYSRICADVVGMWSTVPLAVVRLDTFSSTADVIASRFSATQNETITPVVTKLAIGRYELQWASSYIDDDGITSSLVVTRATVSPYGTPAQIKALAMVESISSPVVTVKVAQINTGIQADRDVTIEIFGFWGGERKLSDYGASTRKRNDRNEYPTPYAGAVMRDIVAQRGSAYASQQGTLVYAENLAMSRFWGAIAYRFPERLAANLTPSGAGDGLEYWAQYTGVRPRPGDSDDSVRNRVLVHYGSGGKAATYDNLVSGIGGIIGDAFVGLTINHDGNLDTWSANTYWPVKNPGPEEYDLGGGAWTSDRAHIVINAQRPPGMTPGEYEQIMNVDLFNYVDRAISIWSSVQWRDADTPARAIWGDFVWGDGTVWGSIYDWH